PGSRDAPRRAGAAGGEWRVAHRGRHVTRRMRALVVDDEPLARRRLRELLLEFSGIEQVGEAVDGASAVSEIDALRPDIVFLDVEMPQGTGLEVLDRITHDPAVIFTTAHDKYAVSAFELQAVDYLLKPFGKDRLARALERLAPPGGGTADRARDAMAVSANQPLTRIIVRDRGRLVPISMGDVVRLEASDDYTSVHVKGKMYLVYLPLSEFERKLDPAKYMRVHRSHVVSLDHVAQFTPADGGRYELEMTDGTCLPVSRAYAKALRERAV
ncbi:MAG TPA: LytTR family DNA-binding domain-containing protein, partial [Gemmatimonadaceae bacterium]|nr:LytTR family DNA-binding domain-containing protein [Gemmatimonadaceae bacterium]